MRFPRFASLVFVGASWAAGQGISIDVSALESTARQELQSTRTPGAAIGIVENGRLIYAHGFGTSNIETGAPITQETLFRLGSTTKMMTATAVATLAAQGKLDFSDPVGKHLHGLDPAIAALTVNQILSHTSGLQDTAVMNGRHDDAALGEEIRAWKSDWLFTKPGSIYSYSNPGFWLAGYVAESIAGEPYARVMERLVFEPVGMASTTLRPTMAMTRPLSQGHDLVNGSIAVLRPAPDNSANWPAGSVFSNLVDLSHFMVSMMGDGKLPPAVIHALTTPHADIPGSHSKYGYGLNLDDYAGVLVWSHSGSRAGYGSFIAMLPARHTGVIVLCNRTGESLPRTHGKILAMLGQPTREPGPSSENAIPSTEFAKYKGTYRNGEATIEISEHDGKLLYKSLELRKTSDGWLVAKSPDGKTAARMFAVPGTTGRIEYLHLGGRSSARVP
jgi:CubicO group peptidase (beta-lactamase class C family)